MALYLCLNPDGTNIVTDLNPIQTKHSSEGESVVVPVYIFNDGKRRNVPNDTNPPELIYTNLQVRVEGVSYLLQFAIASDISTTTLTFDSTAGWNIGTVIKSGNERMRIEEVMTSTTVRVQRNYSADGVSSVLQSHNVGASFKAEISAVSLALPAPSDTTYNTVGAFVADNGALASGVDPSLLQLTLDANETSNIVKSNNAGKYRNNSLIKIDNEVMKVVAVSGSDIQVIRGYNGTVRAVHNVNSVIYCCGIVDKSPITHKVFIKNDPPSGLPTQKKKDVKIVVVADEEPL